MRGRFIAIVAGETRNMLREPELSFLLLAPFLIGLLLRLGLSPLVGLVKEGLAYDLRVHIPFILGFLMLVPPLLVGMVVGFRLIDDRDGGILDYIAVTPLDSGGYIILRLILPSLLSIPLTAMLPYFLTGYEIELPSPHLILGIAAINALGAPILVLILTAFAENKIAAMALAKVAGILFLAPLAGYLISHPALYLLGIIPPFWGPLAFVRAAAGEAVGGYIAAGFLSAALWLALLSFLYSRRRRRAT